MWKKVKNNSDEVSTWDRLLQFATQCKFTFWNSFYKQINRFILDVLIFIILSSIYVVKLEDGIMMPH